MFYSRLSEQQAALHLALCDDIGLAINTFIQTWL
jgi:hypothetical protein